MPKLKPRPKMGGYADNRYDPDNMPAPSAQFHPTGTSAWAEPMATDPTSANPTPYYDTAARRAREAEADALFGASYVDDGMLDDMSDPLAINARLKPRPPPPHCTAHLRTQLPLSRWRAARLDALEPSLPHRHGGAPR